MSSKAELISKAASYKYQNSEKNEVTFIRIQNSLMMTVKEMANLYGVQRPAIYKQLKNLFQKGKINKKEVSIILTQKADDGKLYRTTFYDQDIIYTIGKKIKPQEVEKMKLWFNNYTR